MDASPLSRRVSRQIWARQRARSIEVRRIDAHVLRLFLYSISYVHFAWSLDARELTFLSVDSMTALDDQQVQLGWNTPMFSKPR